MLIISAYQSNPDRKADQPGYIMNVQTFHYLCAMSLDGLDAESQVVRDLLCRTAGRDGFQNFLLSRGKRFESGFGIGWPDVGLDNLPRNFRAQIGFSIGHRLQREFQFQWRSILQYIADGTRFQGL